MSSLSLFRPLGSLRAAAFLAGLSAITAGHVAAQLYWDTNGAAAGSGTTTPGTWDAATANWNTSNTAANTNAPAAWVPGSVAVFSSGTDFGTGTAYTVNVTGTISMAGITVEDGTPTIAGGTLSSSVTTLPLTSNSGRTGTINSVLTGAGLTVNKGGAGLLILGGANTFTGAVNVPNGAGTLQFNSNAATGPSAGRFITPTGTGAAGAGFAIDQTFVNKIATGSTGVVALGADSGQPVDLSAFSSLWLGANGTRIMWGSITPQTGGAYRFGGGGGELVLQTQLTGANNVIVGNANNTVTIRPENGKVAANNFTGNVTIQDTAILRVMEAGALPTTANITVAASGGTLQFQLADNNDAQFVRGLGSGANQIQFLGGTAGFSAFDGRMTIDLGGSGSTIQWGSASFNPSTFQLGTAANSNSVIHFKNGLDANGANRLIQVNGGYVFMDGALTNSSGTGGFEKGSGATMILHSNGNSFNGTFLVNAGTTQIGNNDALGILPGNADLNNANNPTLRFFRSDNVTYAKNITNSGSGSLILEKAGAGTLTLTGANQTRGVTRLQQGTLALDFTAAGAPTDNILNNTANLSQLATRGGNLTVTGTGANTQRFNNYVVDGGASDIAVTGATVTLGNITRTVAGSNDGLGTANFSSTGTINTTSTNVNGILGGYLTVDNAGWASNNGSGTIVALPAGSYATDTWAAGNNTNVTTSSSPASGSTTHSLRFATGSNTVTLSGANVLSSGGVLVTAGAGASTIAGGAGNSLTSSSADLTLSLINHSASPLTVSAPVVGSIGIAKSGPGTVILSGPGNFTGGSANNRVIVNDGKLSVTGTFAVQATGTFVHRGELEIVGSSGTAAYSTGTTSIGFRTGDAGTLTLRGNNPTDLGITVNGDLNISDLHGSQGTLNVASGIQNILNLYVGKSGSSLGTVNHTGGTLRTGGTGATADWRIGGTSAADSEAVGVYNLSGGTLEVNRNFQIGAWGSGSLVQTGGTTNVIGGVPIIGRFGGSTGLWDLSSGNGVVTQNAQQTATMTTAAAANNTATFIGVAEEGTGTLLVGGTSALNIENLAIGYNGGQGTVTQTGGTITTYGALPWSRAAANPSATAGVSFGTVNPRGSGVYNLNGGTLNTGSISAQAGSGTFNFNGGTLKATLDQPAFVNGSVTTNVQAGGAIIDTNGKNIGIASGLKHDAALGASPDGGLSKNGNGTLTLGGSNTYTGATVINGGVLKLESASATLPVAATIRFDASNAASVSLSGASVTGMNDLGAQGNNAIVPSGVVNPTYNASGLNGLGTVTFNTPNTGAANSSRLETTANTGIDGAEARTYIAVMRREENGAIFVHSGNTGTSGQAFGIGNESGGYYGYSWGAPGNDAFSGARPNNTFEVYTARYNGSQIESYVNGALMDISNTTTLTTATSNTPLMLGSRRNAANNGGYGGGQGSLAEVVVFDSSLSDADRQAVERYLNYKWFNIGTTQDVLPTATPVTINGTGVLDLGGTNQTIGSLASASATTEVKLTSATLTVGNLGTDTVFAGAITGSGALVKDGIGKLSLSGASTYTGATTVSAGELNVTGTINGTSGMTVASGARLSGTGVVTSTGTVTFASGAKLSPGNSPGTLTFGSSVDLSATVSGGNTGNLLFELDTPATSDQVVLTAGTLTIGSGELNFDDFSFSVLGGFGAGTYVLFDGVNDINGTLGASLTGNLGAYQGTLAYADGTKDIVLNVTPIPEPAFASLLSLGTLAGLRRRRK